jgi:lipoprotein-releasing system ATP-binding protein
VQQILRDLAHQTGKAVVAVTHDPVFASSADRRIMLIDGKINPDLS